MYQLTIIGDRQHGRPRALMDMAIDEAARRGGVVWYQTPNLTMASHMVGEIVARAKDLVPEKVLAVRRINGNRRVTFTGGGEIRFNADNLWKTRQKIGLHCMDDVAGEPYMYADRAVRAVLR